MEKFHFWQLALLVVLLFILALLAVGQAVTFAWLSSFSEQAERLDTLRIKFWIYIVAAMLIAIVDLIGIVKMVKLAASKKRKTD